MAQQKRDTGAETLARLRGQNEMYSFGGGTVGGDIWNWRQPTTIEMVSGMKGPIPELKPQYTGQATSIQDRLSGAAEKRKIDVLPAGAGSAQEQQFMRDRATQQGRNWVEAPERFVRGRGTSEADSGGQFYSAVTGRPMGTLMGVGEYEGFGGRPNTSQRSWSNYVGNNPIDNRIGTGFYEDSPFYRRGGTGGPQPERSVMSGSGQATPMGSMGMTGSPLSFTSFGQMTSGGPQPTATMTPIQSLIQQEENPLTSFRGIPRFPFSNY